VRPLKVGLPWARLQEACQGGGEHILPDQVAQDLAVASYLCARVAFHEACPQVGPSNSQAVLAQVAGAVRVAAAADAVVAVAAVAVAAAAVVVAGAVYC